MSREARRCSCCNGEHRPVMCVVEAGKIIIRSKRHGKTHTLYMDLVEEYNKYIETKRLVAPIEQPLERPAEAP